MLDRIAELAGWGIAMFDDYYDINGVELSEEDILSPRNLWIAHDVVRQVLKGEPVKKALFITYLTKSDEPTTEGYRAWLSFNATNEMIYEALLKTVGK